MTNVIDNEKTKIEGAEQKIEKPNPLEIKVGSKKYVTTATELEDVLVSILSSGSFTKTFSLYGGKLELTFTSISEEERMKGYEIARQYIDKNSENISKVMVDAYTSRINIALQLIRIKTNGHTTNLAEGAPLERLTLLLETPEDVLRVYSQYLIIFAELVNMAFNMDEVLKNS